MIVIMAGLPATGKSTLAQNLASRTSGLVIDKDTVREALFSEFVDYSREQDDLAMECVFSAAEYAARVRPSLTVFIDGCTFARRSQLARALDTAARAETPWRIIETVCSDDAVLRRLEAGAGAKEHPAANRTFELYVSLKSRREAIDERKLVVDTERSLAVCLRECLAYINSKSG